MFDPYPPTGPPRGLEASYDYVRRADDSDLVSLHILSEDVLRHRQLRLNRGFPFFVTPQIAHRDSPALTFLDYLGYISPGGGFSSVDRQDTVTRLQTCLFSRRTTLHIAYVGRGVGMPTMFKAARRSTAKRKLNKGPAETMPMRFSTCCFRKERLSSSGA